MFLGNVRYIPQKYLSDYLHCQKNLSAPLITLSITACMSGWPALDCNVFFAEVFIMTAFWGETENQMMCCKSVQGSQYNTFFILLDLILGKSLE